AEIVGVRLRPDASRRRRSDADLARGLVLAAVGRIVAAPLVGVDFRDEAAGARDVDVAEADRLVRQDLNVEQAARAGQAVPEQGSYIVERGLLDVLAEEPPVAEVVAPEDRLALLCRQIEVELEAVAGPVRAGAAGRGGIGLRPRVQDALDPLVRDRD